MSDWLLVLILVLAISVAIWAIFGILLLIDYIIERIRLHNKSAKFDLRKYEYSYGTVKDFNDRCRQSFFESCESNLREVDLESTIDNVMKQDITVNDLKSFNGSIHGEFEDWHIPGLIQKDE